MGSFSTSCMVSGLPIGYGTNVRFIGLVKNPYESYISCDAQCWWTPIHPGIKAKYNDYGSIEDIEEGILADTFFEDLSRRALPHTRESDYHDVDIVKDMPREQWLEALYLHKIQFKDSHWKKPGPVRQAMIREDVWQILLEMIPDEDRFETCCSEITGYGHRRRTETMLETAEILEKTSASDEYLKDVLHALRKSLEPSPIHAEQKELFRVLVAMNSLCRVWLPGHTAGPQCPEWDTQAHFTSAINDLAEKFLRQEDEE